MPAENSILDATFLKKLERLSLASKRPFAGQMKGEKRSIKRGTSIEFADYREYTLGDDSAVCGLEYGRPQRQNVSEAVRRGGGSSISPSLSTAAKAWTSARPPIRANLHYAIRLAAALGYIGLTNYDRVTVQPYAATLGPTALPTQRGKCGVLPFFSYLEKIQAGRYGSLVLHLACIVLLRLLAPQGRHHRLFGLSSIHKWQQGLKSLLGARQPGGGAAYRSPKRRSSPVCWATCASSTAKRARPKR